MLQVKLPYVPRDVCEVYACVRALARRDHHDKLTRGVAVLQVKLPYVPREVCAERALAVNASFTEGMMCAGYSRSMRGDACTGDSGGPYVMQYSGRFVLVGIVSWGVGCDRENQYGYYTHVSRYYDWILQTTSKASN